MECCSLKIALIQLNPVIGDFENNCARIILCAHQAADLGCELAVFPELAVSGYPPLDLLERASFIEDHEAAVDAMILGLPPISVMPLRVWERLMKFRITDSTVWQLITYFPRFIFLWDDGKMPLALLRW